VTLIDTNVLLDLATDDPVWADWSIRHLDAAAVKGPLVIVYAELSVGFERIEELDDLLDEAGITLEEIPREALFLAGKAFRSNRAAPAWACSRIFSSVPMPPFLVCRC
jgi:hypothetical protein